MGNWELLWLDGKSGCRVCLQERGNRWPVVARVRHLTCARVGGENVDMGSGGVALVQQGLSPQRRGNRLTRALVGMCCRSIPAEAGEPCFASTSNPLPKVYPRRGGGVLW